MAHISSSGVAHFHITCKNSGIPEVTSKTLLKCIEPGTLASHERHWRKFHDWLGNSRFKGRLSIPIICEFLNHMFSVGYNYNT